MYILGLSNEYCFRACSFHVIFHVVICSKNMRLITLTCQDIIFLHLHRVIHLGGQWYKNLPFFPIMYIYVCHQKHIIYINISLHSDCSNTPGMFSKPDFDALAPHIDAFSLMTYDYSNPMR